MDLTWKRSTRCSSNGCVEVAHEDGRVLVRDSKHAHGEPISFMPQTWMATVLAKIMLKRLPAFVHQLPEGGYEWRGYTVDGFEQALVFTVEEWEAFEAGVREGQFNVEALARG